MHPSPTSHCALPLFCQSKMLLLRHKRATASSLIVKAAAVIAAYLHRHRAMARRHNRLGKSPCHRIQHTVEEIYNCLGPIYFRRTYRMSYESFWCLHDKVAPKIDEYIPKYYKYTRKGGREGGNIFPPPLQMDVSQLVFGWLSRCVTLLVELLRT